MLGLLKDSWPNILMCLFNLNPGDITGDFKFVCSSTEDILLHITTQPYCHFVFSLQQINFHFTSLSENLFLVAFLILRMLHCVCGQYELRLLAFDVLWNTIPDLHGRRVSLVTNWRSSGMRLMLTGSKRMRTTVVDHFEMMKTLCMSLWRDSACIPSVHGVLLVTPNSPV